MRDRCLRAVINSIAENGLTGGPLERDPAWHRLRELHTSGLHVEVIFVSTSRFTAA